MAAPIKFDIFQKLLPAIDNGAGEGEEAGPCARSGHRVVTDGNNLYSIGGYNPAYWDVENTEDSNYPLFKELWQYNFVTRKWKKLNTTGPFPFEMASHSAMLVGNRNLFVLGGTGIPFGEASSDQLRVCNLHTRQWTHIQCTGEFPIRSYGQSMNLVGEHLYVIGGTTGWEYNIQVHRLHLPTRVWQTCEVEKHPGGRYRHETVEYKGKLHVFAGGQAQKVYKFLKMPVFDTERLEWDYLPTYPDATHGHPAARRCHSCCQLGPDVYMCGGYDGAHIFGDVWHLNLDTYQWRKLRAELPEPVYFHSAALTESGCLLVHGGVTEIDTTRINSLYALWVRVPSLRELAWQAIRHAVPHLAHLSPHTLLSAGVPYDLVSQLAPTA